jgi:hypothetical protein
VAAYTVPAALAWAAVGLVLSALVRTAPEVATAAIVAAAVYGCGYGAAEVCGATWPGAPGRRWQVPQDLLIGVSGGRVLVWGSILGPGFLTRNPYAGFGILPVLVAATGTFPAGIWIAALIGASHASGRACGLLRDSARARAGASARAGAQDQPFRLLLRSLRWRVLDGLALLAVAGAAIVIAGFRLG